MKNPKVEVKNGYLENINKPLFQLSELELRDILDSNWYPRACQALHEQRKVWDYSYLSYKGIMLNEEVNRKRRANQFGMYVNVPRTFMTVEGIRRNFNISKLRVNLESVSGMKMADTKRRAISSFLNYDLKRSGTHEQVKDAGFYKLLFGNGFLYSYLSSREGRYGKITGDIDEKTAVVKNTLDDKNTVKYFGMVARAVSPYKVFPDPEGTTHDYNDAINRPCEYTCIRNVKKLSSFRRDWKGIVPDKILNSIQPGGFDLTNYEAVRETIDSLFRYDSLRYPGTVSDFVSSSKVVKMYDRREYVEERVWLGEDFLIVQAGAGMKFCLISPNPNPKKMSNIVKLDDVRIPGEYWSLGEAYIQRYQQIEENRIHNSLLDTLHFSISGMLGLNTQYLEDSDDLEIYPQKVWKLKGIPGVKIDEMIQQFSPSSSGIAGGLKFLEKVKADGQSATLITDFVTGASKSLAETATESNRLAGASYLAISDKIKEVAGGALTETAKIFLSMYPIAYSDKRMDGFADKTEITFVGQTKKDIPTKELQEIVQKRDIRSLVFLDDVDIVEPQFNIIGDVSADRGETLKQWIAAIDFSKSINEVAYATGDRRRLDIIKMGQRGLELFDVVDNTDEYVLEEQPIKTDEIQLNAELNQAGGNLPGEAGAPQKNKIAQPQSYTSGVRQQAQPRNRGMNQSSKKNI